ncbi:hypothetical protein D3C78_1458820 [compost metagenome]
MGLLPLLQQQRDERTDTVDDALQVDIEHALPLRRADFPAKAGLHHACVVEQQVDAAPVLHGGIAQTFDLSVIAHIGDTSNGLRACANQLIAQRLQAGSLHIGQYQAHAQARCMLGQPSANTAGGTGDHRYLPLSVVHCPLLPLVQ